MLHIGFITVMSFQNFQVKEQPVSDEAMTDTVVQKTLNMFDFGGQCAYYACHQIYLTRRAFYMVVVDASKRLGQVVDKEVCDQAGTVFSGWSYGGDRLIYIEHNVKLESQSYVSL